MEHVTITVNEYKALLYSDYVLNHLYDLNYNESDEFTGAFTTRMGWDEDAIDSKIEAIIRSSLVE